MTTRPLVVRPDELDKPAPLVVRPDELDKEESAPPQRQGPVQRYRGSLREAMGFQREGGVSEDLSQIGQGFKQMATHPIDSLKDLIHGASDAQQQTIDQANLEMASPRLATKVKGYVRGGEAMIPLVGPLLSRAGDQMSEGDYAGGLGTMTPLAAGRPLEEGVRMGRSGLASAVRAAPEVGGAVAGYAAVPEHPYIGAYVGRTVGEKFAKPAGRLADIIEPKGTKPVGRLSKQIGGEWVPEGNQIKGEEGAAGVEGTKGSGKVPGGRDPKTGKMLPWKDKGAAAEPTTGPKAESAAPKASLKENLAKDIEATKPKGGLSDYMKNKVEDSESRRGASLAAEIDREAGYPSEEIRASSRSRSPRPSSQTQPRPGSVPEKGPSSETGGAIGEPQTERRGPQRESDIDYEIRTRTQGQTAKFKSTPEEVAGRKNRILNKISEERLKGKDLGKRPKKVGRSDVE